MPGRSEKGGVSLAHILKKSHQIFIIFVLKLNEDCRSVGWSVYNAKQNGRHLPHCILVNVGITQRTYVEQQYKNDAQNIAVRIGNNNWHHITSTSVYMLHFNTIIYDV